MKAHQQYIFTYVAILMFGILISRCAHADEPVQACEPKIVYVTKKVYVDRPVYYSQAPMACKEGYTLTQTVDGKSFECKLTQKPYKQYRNRVSLLAGSGPKHKLDTHFTPTSATVILEQTAIFGLQYQRSLTDRVSLGILGFSNESGALSLGFDF